MGQVVLKKEYSYGQVVNLSLEGTQGLYWLTVRTEEGMKTLKIVKE